VQTTEIPDPEEQRELESRAAGLKAANTWHASHAIQEAREACGGAGYLAENRLIALRGDTDVFTTFEGDNHVLIQLVAKELLTAYADDIKSMSPVEWVRFAANTVSERVIKRTAAQPIIQTLIDTRQDNEEEGSLFNRGTQLQMFEDRERYALSSVARRLQGRSKEMDAFDAFNEVQDHVLHAASAHIDRIILHHPGSVRRRHRVMRGRRGQAGAVDGVRPVCPVGDRRGQGVVRRTPVTCLRSGRRPPPAGSTNAAARCGRTRRLWSTGSGFPSSCAMYRCCIRSASAKTTELFGWERVQRPELAIVAELVADLADSGRLARGVAALLPLVLHRDRVLAGIQHRDVWPWVPWRGADRRVPVEEQQLLRRGGIGAG
jgi:hypothetical protein